MTAEEFAAWLRSPPLRRRTLLQGVLNVTPDSFSDGGQFLAPAIAADHASRLIEAGADLIDIGGESTRPGSQPVAPDQQIARVVPVIRAVVERLGSKSPPASVAISIDTTRAEVAQAALDAGATIVNDISAGEDDPAMLPLVARRAVPVILMHMQGTPATMQVDPRYVDVTQEVGKFLGDRAAAASGAGISPENILIDPGIGFGKTTAHNLQLLRELRRLSVVAGGYPLVIGTSRKGFIGKITGVSDPDNRVFGTAATIAWSVANGAGVVRVHDVGEMAQVVRMTEAIQRN